MRRSKIGFVDYSGLSVVMGCTKISPGCENCWAQRLLQTAGLPTEPQVRRDALRKCASGHFDTAGILRPTQNPLAFVAGLGDLFHASIPVSYLNDVFTVLLNRPDITWYISTRRYEHARNYLNAAHDNLANVWLAFSASTQEEIATASAVLASCTTVGRRVLCIEPLLTPAHPVPNWDKSWLDWVILGGDTGPVRRAWDPSWALPTRDWCRDNGVPFWFKQHGDLFPDRNCLLEGEIWHGMPDDKPFDRLLV